MSEQHHFNWNVDAIWTQLNPLLPGIAIEVLARTDSTNSALLERVRRTASELQQQQRGYGRRSHDLEPCLLVAEHQTQGRGRMGRPWMSAPGGSLTFSIALVLDMADWSGLSLAVGCAVANALEPLADGQAPRLQLKWPNDIWLADPAGGGGRKLGGILIETVPAGAKRMAVIGIGINLNALAAPPAESASAAYTTGFASLDELAPELADPPTVLARIAAPLARALREFPQAGFAPWQADFTRRDLTLNRAVSAGALEGIARGVDASGALRVETADGQTQQVAGGEVSVRLAAPPPPPSA